MIDDRHARDWCVALARTLEVQHVEQEGRAYLDRYFAAGWRPSSGRPGPAIFLHHFRASDATGMMHSHPWAWGASLILAGGYREARCVEGRVVSRECRPGDVNVLEADDVHRIDLLTRDCWSLFLAADYRQPWRFVPRCGEGGSR